MMPDTTAGFNVNRQSLSIVVWVKVTLQKWQVI